MAQKAPKPDDGDEGAQPADKPRRKSKVKGGDAPPTVVDDATIEHHYGLISIAQKDLAEADAKRATASGVLRNAFKAAKKMGVDIEAMKQALKDKKQEPGVVITLERNRRRYLKIMGAPVGTQFDLLSDVEVKDTIDAELAGYHAGKNNESADNNAYQPGTEEHARWTTGWNRWVAENAPGAKKADPVETKIAMEYEAEGADAYKAGVSLADNPYADGLPANPCWNAGWKAAQTRASAGDAPAADIPAFLDKRKKRPVASEGVAAH
jgi:ribosome modulation factor